MSTTTPLASNRANPSDSAPPRWPPYSGATAWAFMITALAIIATSFIIRFAGLPRGINITLAILPLPGLAAIIYFGIKCLRAMDELERRIQAEALAIAFGIISGILVIYGQLQSSGVFSEPEKWPILWPMMWGIYLASFTWVRRRYQ